LTIILIHGEMLASRSGCTAKPATVYVCICNGVTDHDIRQAAEAGCESVTELTMRTGVGANCGSCLDMAGALLDAAHAVRELPFPVLQQAA
jgi:bacterioferritin-associated ferredoxin